jgi:phosphocarrier protein
MGLLNRKTGAGASAQKAEKEITIVNRLGLHARPAALFVKVASRFRAEVWVKRKTKKEMARALWVLNMLAADKDLNVQIRCEGPDAERALDESRGAD